MKSFTIALILIIFTYSSFAQIKLSYESIALQYFIDSIENYMQLDKESRIFISNINGKEPAEHFYKRITYYPISEKYKRIIKEYYNNTDLVQKADSVNFINGKEIMRSYKYKINEDMKMYFDLKYPFNDHNRMVHTTSIKIIETANLAIEHIILYEEKRYDLYIFMDLDGVIIDSNKFDRVRTIK